MEVEGVAGKINVAVVYIVPKNSTRYGGNVEARRELEEDIIVFRARGMVILI